MKLYLVIFMFVFSGCSEAAEDKESISNTEICDIFFNEIGPCAYKDITVDVSVINLASDEKLLQKLTVINNGRKHTLNISKNTTIIDGDMGYISFVDINFDSIPDIAITTSFGLANLYFDYWVFDTTLNKYSYIGNFTQFKIDSIHKTLSNVVKISAAKYKNAVYTWKGFKLIKNK